MHVYLWRNDLAFYVLLYMALTGFTHYYKQLSVGSVHSNCHGLPIYVGRTIPRRSSNCM